MEESKTETRIEFLKRLSETYICCETDSIIMKAILHSANFPKAEVVCGIVYLEGKGTLEFPPASIHSVAKQFLIFFNDKKTRGMI